MDALEANRVEVFDNLKTEPCGPVSSKNTWITVSYWVIMEHQLEAEKKDVVPDLFEALDFSDRWANCYVYVALSPFPSPFLLLPPSTLNSFSILPSLLPCQDAIICNLPKSSICWDTKQKTRQFGVKWRQAGV